MSEVNVRYLQRLREISMPNKKSVLCQDSQYVICLLIDKKENNEINPEKVDFSSLTVVLGKDGGVSSEIVDAIAEKLQNLNINTFVSDINKMTPSVSEQAISENSSSDILIIKVDGQSIRNMNSTVVVGCETSKYDSLGLALASGIGIDKTTIEKGKMISGINIPTELENIFSKRNFDNMVSVVTVVSGVDAEPNELANNIVDGIIRFSLFTDVEKEREYYSFSEKNKNWKPSPESKTGVVTNPLIYPEFCFTEISKTNTKKM